MKTALLVFCSAICFTAAAQDADSLAPKPRTHHEIGVNATLLLKQVFNLSNNTFPTLPYDITYKCIRNKSALRFGIGITVDNTKLERSQSFSSGIPGPNDDVPTYSHSFSTSLRAGWEKRFPFEKRFVAFAGIDLAGAVSNATAQTTFLYNNLPSSYNFQKTTSKQNTMKVGGGPVAGLQFNISKRLSLLTEIPVYAFYTHGKSETSNYSNTLDFNGEYHSSTDSETETSSGINLAITLPVTLYLVVRF